MAQNKRSIDLSVCKIMKEQPGNHLATVGSACILECPCPQEAALSSEKVSHTFLVMTSQVVSKDDFNSSAACKAEFLPLKRGNTEKYILNELPLHEVQISGQNSDISLILISSKELHKQRRMSKYRSDQFQSDRARRPRSRKSEPEATDSNPQKQYCYVMCEAGSDKFTLQCYWLYGDQCGSYFLQFPGNKSAKLRTLADFCRSDRTESPIGSVILNFDGEVVGFLSFDDNDMILPLFLPDNLQDGIQASNGQVLTENKHDINLHPGGRLKTLTDQVKNKDMQDDSGSSDMDCPNHEEVQATDQPKLVPPLPAPEEIHGSSADCRDDQSESLNSQGNLVIRDHSQQSHPTEMSFVSESGMEETGISIGYNEGAPDPSTARQSQEQSLVAQFPEEGNADGGDQHRNGANKDQEPQKHPLPRCYSEMTSTPKTERKFPRCQSELPHLPLKSVSGTPSLVEKFILPSAYVMDTLKRHLDTTYTKNIENWQHLAERQEVSPDKIMQLKCQSPESRSEALFQVLCTCTADTNLSIGALIHQLRDLEMKNVVTCIEEQHLKDEMKVEEVLETGSFPGRFFVLLDQKPEDKWNQLGTNLGVDLEILEEIKIDCATRHHNPAQEVIELIYTSRPSMTINHFKDKLREIKRDDIIKRLDRQATENYATIRDLLNDLDLMAVITRKLNGSDNARRKNYKHLARVCDIPAEKYECLQPPGAESPTEEVIRDIVGRKPRYTVCELITDLHGMKRLDAIKAISPYFVEEEFTALKRDLNIPDD